MIGISAIHFSAFKLVNDLKLEDFTEYSDHAPVTLALNTNFTHSQLQCTCVRRTTTSASWNPEYAQQLHDCVLVNRDSLSACVNNIMNIIDINETIYSLTSTIKSITDQFCTKHILTLKYANSAN